MAEEKKTTTKKVAATKTATKAAPKKEVVKEAKATETKKEKAVKKIRVTLVKSPIGYKYDQRKTVEALGLNKLNSSHELVDNPAVRGMIFKVKHLVRVEEI